MRHFSYGLYGFFSHVLNNASVWWWSAHRPKLVTLEITVYRINISTEQFVFTCATKCFLKRININIWKPAVILSHFTHARDSSLSFICKKYSVISRFLVSIYIYIYIYIYTNTTNTFQKLCQFLDSYCIWHSYTIRLFPYRGQSSIWSSCNADR